MGKSGDDVAIYSGVESRYTVTFYDSKGNKSDKGYQSDGFVKVVDSTDETASEGTDTLYGIEGIEFSDGYLGFKKVETFKDLDGDGKPDVEVKKVQVVLILLKVLTWMKNLKVQKALMSCQEER